MGGWFGKLCGPLSHEELSDEIWTQGWLSVFEKLPKQHNKDNQPENAQNAEEEKSHFVQKMQYVFLKGDKLSFYSKMPSD